MKYLICIFWSFVLLSCNSQITNSSSQPTEISLEEMVGQMIMIGARGFTIDEMSETIKRQIREGKAGGFVFFDYDVINKEAKRNIKSPTQVKKLISDLNTIAPTPLFMAVDQEGGKVNRLKTKYGFPRSVSNQYLGQLDNIDSTRYYAKINAKNLSELGFNVNFSPAVDLEINKDNPVIGKIQRSYSENPDIVIKHSKIWIDAHHQKKVLSTLKHFPGHGSSDVDSHYGVTDITNYWQEAELKPFEVLTKSNKSVAVMTAHVVNNDLDPDIPATMSSKIINNILRKQIGFDGLVFSDDLQMKAVNAMFDFKTILKNAINAGVDILVTGNNLEYKEDFADEALKLIVTMVNNGELQQERIKQSYDRIIKVKKELEIIP